MRLEKSEMKGSHISAGMEATHGMGAQEKSAEKGSFWLRRVPPGYEMAGSFGLEGFPSLESFSSRDVSKSFEVSTIVMISQSFEASLGAPQGCWR